MYFVVNKLKTMILVFNLGNKEWFMCSMAEVYWPRSTIFLYTYQIEL